MHPSTYTGAYGVAAAPEAWASPMMHHTYTPQYQYTATPDTYGEQSGVGYYEAAARNTAHSGRAQANRNPEREWIKLVGLPYDAREQDLRTFLAAFNVAEQDSIIFVMSAGKPCGRAFARLASTEEAARAARALNKQFMGQRYVDVRQVALREVQRELREVASSQESLGSDPRSRPVGVDRSIRNPVPFLAQHRVGNCIKLVGLPYQCTDVQLCEFLNGVRVRVGGVHFMTRNGKPNGNCVVELEDPLEAYKAVQRAHRKYLGRRFIEVYLARPCDLYCDADELKTYLRIQTVQDTVTNEDIAGWCAHFGLAQPRALTLLPTRVPNALEAFLQFADEESATTAASTFRSYCSFEKVSLCTPPAYVSAVSKRQPVQHNDSMPLSPMHHTPYPTGPMHHTLESPVAPPTHNSYGESDDASEESIPPSPINNDERLCPSYSHDPYSLDRFADDSSYDEDETAGQDENHCAKKMKQQCEKEVAVHA